MVTLFLKRMFFNCVTILFCLTLIPPIGCSERSHSTITIKGSTTVHPILDRISTEYMKKKDINIVQRSEGSHTGIRALIDGQCDIAASSSRITQPLIQAAESKKTNLKEFVFAYDLIIPIMHPSNPVQNLSIDQLRDLFTGSNENWSEVGGKAEKVLVVNRNMSSGTRKVWEENVTKFENAPKEHIVLQSNSEVLAFVTKNHSAIGYISIGYVNHDVKTVSVNGIEPTLENAGNHKFPLHRNLYLYVADGKFSYEIKSFIIYLLSRDGQEIVKQSGFIPLYPLSLDK